MFYNTDGAPFLVATIGGLIPWSAMKQVYEMEHVVHKGEQMHSFNAAFSKKGSDGMPELICNSETGKINTEVVSHWKKYDITLNLKKDWNSLKSDLDGKVLVTLGYQDNFLLNDAVTLLEAQMKGLESTFQFAYYPGDHFTVRTADYRKDGAQFLKQKYLEWLAKSGIEKK